MLLRDAIQQVLSYAKEEMRKKENAEIMQREILEPVVQFVLQKLYPYLIVSSAAFLIVFLCVITILVLIFQIRIPNPSAGTVAT